MRRLDLDGRTLGEFTLREKIGEGGFAAVHRAEQTTLGREAVVKVLHTRLASTPEVAQRFLREARLASRIDHPYAAHVYAFGAEPDGLLWIAMELVRGTPMDKLLDQQGPLTLDQLVPLFERICEVVQNAHDHGIVHRDLKPGNVMVMTRGGRLLPKLLDFGIARALDDAEPIDTADGATATATSPADDARSIDPRATTKWVEVDRAGSDGTRRGAVMGSPSYMAPEQWIDAGSVGPATDIYALGVLAFQALTGSVPFTGTLEAIRLAHLEAPPPKLGAQFPPAVDAILARALAKRPLERYASAADLAAALRAAAGFEDGVLPQLPAAIRDAAIANAVQPLAEAIVALDNARNLDQAVALISDVAAVATRWIAIVALAARSAIGAGDDADSQTVRDKLRQLGRGRLDDATWLALATELTRPFVDKAAAYPVPELVAMLHGGDFGSAYRHVHELAEHLDRRVQRGHEERRAEYGEALNALARLLEALAPLHGYAVIVPRGGRAERWRGVRRHPRAIATVTGALIDGRPLLVDRTGSAVLQLAPLVQVATPSPGRDEELFVLDGKGTRTARLVALPYGFERSDPALHDWLRDELGDLDEPTAAEPESPYRGLAPFTAELAGDYVGREREVETFINRLIAEPLLAVVGPSGAGKSSFVQAGVLANLPARWRAIIVRPGASPLAALEAHLQAAGVDARGLEEDPGQLAEALRDAGQREGATLVLVIDQLEELFTLCKEDRERTAFAAALADATRTELDPIRIVVTLRDDFLIRAAGMPILGDRLARGLVLLAVPAVDDLERIVTEPARRAGYELEDPALATEMVDAVASQPGALALLSFTAAELWKLRDRHFRQLTRKAYTAIGGVAGAIAKHAEATLAELSAEDRRLVRIAFRNLVTVDGTRQVLTVDELHQLLAPAPKQRAQTVVDRLIDARLLVTFEDAGGVARIEVIHEALLSHWPRLVEWRREDAEGARMRDQLRVAARQWDARGRPRGLLWRDDALAEYRLWRTRHPGAMTELEEAFGRTSLDDEARRRRLRRIVLTSTFLALGAIAVVLYQLRERATEQSTRAIAESQRAEQEKTRAEIEKTNVEARENEMRVINAGSVVERDPTTTLGWLKHYPLEGPSWNQVRELVLEAQHLGVARHVLVPDEPRWVGFAGEQRVVTAGGQSIQTWDRVTGQLLGRITHPVRLIDFSSASLVVWPDGSRIAFTDSVGDVWIARLPVGTPARVLNEPAPLLAVSRDGRYLASVGERVQLFAIGGELQTLEGHRGSVTSVMFSPDSQRLVTGGGDGTLRSWDVATGIGRIEATVSQPIEDLAVRADSIVFGTTSETLLLTPGRAPKRLVAAADLFSMVTADGFFASNRTEAHLWNASGVERTIPRAAGELFAASANGRVAVLSTGEGPIAIELPRGHTRRLLGHRTSLAAAVSPSGSGLAVIGGDDRLRVWEGDPTPAWVLRGHTAEISEITFAPDGRSVATAGMDRDVRVWSFETGEVTTLGGHEEGVYRVAYSPDGKQLVSSIWGRAARIWDVAAGKARVLDHPVAVTEMRFDGTRIYTATDRGVWVWNVAAGAQQLFAQPNVLCVEPSPDGRFVAAGSRSGEILLWDLKSGTSRVFGSQPEEVDELRFLPDGRLISRTGRTATRHRLRTWTPEGSSYVLLDSPFALRTLAVSANARVAVGGEGSDVHVFDLRAGKKHVFHSVDKQIRALAFSPDGALLASGSQDATARLWTVDTGASQLLHRFEQAVRSVAFSRDGARVAAASNDRTAWVGEVRVERSLAVGARAVVDRIDQLTTVRIDRARLSQGRNEGATTPISSPGS